MQASLHTFSAPLRACKEGSLNAARPRGFTLVGSRSSAARPVAAVDTSHAGLHSSESEQKYLQARVDAVGSHFPNSLVLDDFIHKVEGALYKQGFNGDNTIACVNICRDEITGPLKNKIDLVFGHSFNVNGLGGVLTSGVIGMGAGLSHSPVDMETGRERYVFFSFPHIAVSPYNEPGTLCRPGRPGQSKACGAIVAALGQLQSEGVEGNVKDAGVHEPDNPEYSILKARLARRLHQDKTNIKSLDLVGLTKVAERVITADLEYLISKAVDTSKADYAVIAGVQIHSWGKEHGDGTPNLEFVQPVASYAVVNGQRKELDLNSVPSLTPRQTRQLLANTSGLTQGGPENSSQTIGGQQDITDSSGALGKGDFFKNLLDSFPGSSGGNGAGKKASFFG